MFVFLINIRTIVDTAAPRPTGESLQTTCFSLFEEKRTELIGVVTGEHEPTEI